VIKGYLVAKVVVVLELAIFGNYILSNLAFALKLSLYIISFIDGLFYGFLRSSLLIKSKSSFVTVVGAGLIGFSLRTFSLRDSIVVA
jgi:hypothetical protein